MLLAGRGTELKAKLTQKGGKYLPTASVMKLMPAGTGSLNEVPTLERYLRTTGGNRELAIKQYSAAIRDVTRVFGRVHQTNATLEEHDRYMVWIAAWAQISGFGEFVVIDESLKPGADGYLKPKLNEDGSQRVVLPEMLTGMLLEMASGAKSTPKGGLNELLKAHMDLAVASASEPGGGLAVVEEAVARAQEGQLPAQEGAAMGSGLAPREAVVPAQEEELPGEGGDRAARAAARARTREVGLRSASRAK